MAYFKVLSRHYPGESTENDERRQSGTVGNPGDIQDRVYCIFRRSSCIYQFPQRCVNKFFPGYREKFLRQRNHVVASALVGCNRRSSGAACTPSSGSSLRFSGPPSSAPRSLGSQAATSNRSWINLEGNKDASRNIHFYVQNGLRH